MLCDIRRVAGCKIHGCAGAAELPCADCVREFAVGYRGKSLYLCVGVWTAIRSAICSTRDLTTILPLSSSDPTLHHLISGLISCIGYSPIRHLSPRTIPGSHPPRRPPRRETACPPRKQSRRHLHLRRHVDARHHVATGRLHHRRRSQQVQHR